MAKAERVSGAVAFRAPVEDIMFSLNHVACAGRAPFWEPETASDVIGHFARFAEDVIAPLNLIGDVEGARLENGRVIMPDGFRGAYQQMAGDGWQGLTAPEEFGGMQQSPLVAAGVSEVFTGANHAMQMVCGLVPGAIDTFLHFGTKAQQEAWLPRLASGELLSTMCLTEPGAGSDLSRITCRAEETAQGWRISGEKIFISGGDQDMSEGILHLVLARSGPREAGIKGLSLYLCVPGPGVSVTRIEEKLGLHASPTCQMLFDAAPAELIGAEGEGLKAMFTVMNQARIDVALQGVAHAARAAHISADYAATRTQGRKSDGAPAVLADHADVIRMCETQDALAVGARAMCHIALVEMATGAGQDLAELLTSLCKVFCTEAGIRSADLGMQVLGGYGYLEEYGLSQCWRDARITSIYEGANGIHERTIATRCVASGGVEAFGEMIDELTEGELATDLESWREKLDAIRVASDPTPHAHNFARATAELFFQAAWVKIASKSGAHPDPARLSRLAGRARAL